MSGFSQIAHWLQVTGQARVLSSVPQMSKNSESQGKTPKSKKAESSVQGTARGSQGNGRESAGRGRDPGQCNQMLKSNKRTAYTPRALTGVDSRACAEENEEECRRRGQSERGCIAEKGRHRGAIPQEGKKIKGMERAGHPRCASGVVCLENREKQMRVCAPGLCFRSDLCGRRCSQARPLSNEHTS